jgi:hypothetical protein
VTKRTTAFASVLIFVFFGAGFIYADEADPIRMEVATEMKTGLFWDSRGWTDLTARVRIHHNEDAGTERGRLRLDMRFIYGNLGLRTRFTQDMTQGAGSVIWEYAYAYGSFLDDQMMVTIGRLGESPWEWGASAPRWIWVPHTHELAMGIHRTRLDDVFGIRIEARPAFVPGLSIGFTLNQWDHGGPPWAPEVSAEDVDIQNLLEETVFGIAYTNHAFHGRLSLRLDSDVDAAICRFNNNRRVPDGMSLMYRLEPRFISNAVPGLSVWAHGWFSGLGAEGIDTDRIYRVSGSDPTNPEFIEWHGHRNTMLHLRNWLYIDFTQPAFSATLRLGAHLTDMDSHVFLLRPSIFVNLLDNLQVGLTLGYEYNFGELAGQAALWPDRLPFENPHFEAFNPAIHYIAAEPQVRLSFGRSYLAFIYGFENRFDDFGGDDLEWTQRHWWNLRFVIAF